jgi:hypothetical protein
MNPLIQLKKATPTFFLIVCLGFLPKTQAVSPPPDGGYPNFTTAEGQKALLHLTTGIANTAVGALSLISDTTGNYNVAVGGGALVLNNADENTAVGTVALLLNTTGTRNTANGTNALAYNSTGNDNTAVGAFALENNTSSGNTAVGSTALYLNTTGVGNTAVGNLTLFSNTTAVDNTAVGSQALATNTTGSDNTMLGYEAATFNSTGSDNTGVGWGAMGGNTTGYHNTAIGSQALLNNLTGYANTGIGYEALLNCTGAGNTGLGYLAGQNLTTGDDNIDIGADGVAGEAGVIRIGRSFINSTYIAGIFDVPVFTGTTAVYINSVGQLGTAGSSARFKQNIRSMDSESEVLLALHPVSFQYKAELDPKGIPQFGLVAEEVDKVDPDLVIRDAEGKPYSVRYDQVNAMLLNEFLKEHKAFVEEQRKVQKLEATVAKQRKDFEAAVGQMTAQIQKVTAQLEVSKAAPQTVLNNQ